MGQVTEKRKYAQRKAANYREFTATVKNVWKIGIGTESMRFDVHEAEQDGVPRTEHAYNCAFRLKANVFKMDTVPQIGDRVLLQYRRSKDIEEIWDVSKARIVAVL